MHESPYRQLWDPKYRMFPPKGKYLAEYQPRMPWQDVHSRVEGPAVRDISMNFVRRWQRRSFCVSMHCKPCACRN
jgi:phosphatidylserine/phosphatidylglycerophosphate/cardiolipin synthase-like enzyme